MVAAGCGDRVDGQQATPLAYGPAVERLTNVVETLDRPIDSGAEAAIDIGTGLPVSSNTPPERYLEMVARAKEYIAAGDIFQVVLSQRFEAPFALPPFALYRALRRTNPSPYLYYLDFGDFAVAGSSPEILVRVKDGDEAKVGDKVNVEIFKAGDTVNIVGTSKGKGFQGVVKRHHFRGGAATHGSMFHRAPGSIGSSAFPSRVLKGMRAAGHMGSDTVTTRNLTVVRVDGEKNILVVKGSVPGAPGGYVVIHKGGGGATADKGKK